MNSSRVYECTYSSCIFSRESSRRIVFVTCSRIPPGGGQRIIQQKIVHCKKCLLNKIIPEKFVSCLVSNLEASACFSSIFFCWFGWWSFFNLWRRCWGSYADEDWRETPYSCRNLFTLLFKFSICLCPALSVFRLLQYCGGSLQEFSTYFTVVVQCHC